MVHFFYGTLRDAELRVAVLGGAVPCRAASLGGYAAREALTEDGAVQSFPVLVPVSGATVPGVIVQLSEAQAARLAWYEIGYDAVALAVELEDGTTVDATVSVAADRWQPGREWSFAAWQAEWAQVCRQAAPEYMALMGRVSPAIAHLRYPMILMRAASALRARTEPAPAVWRRTATDSDVNMISQNTGYVRFFAIEDYNFRHRMFSGQMSRPLDRAVFISGDATVVLPYDPMRDRVLLIEQIRMGPLARGTCNPWQLEAIAGRVDPVESPAQAALREAGEEAGLTLGQLIPAPRFYPSSGAQSEYVYCFLAITDLPDAVCGTGGLDSEDEDIRSHLMPFDELMHLIDTGEVENGPLIVLALWLAARRADLRARNYA